MGNCIDLTKEKALTLPSAGSLEMLRRNGREPNRATLFRWATRGVRGVVLETVKIGGARCTTAEAVERFIERLSNPTASIVATTANQRNRMADRAERELVAAGF